MWRGQPVWAEIDLDAIEHNVRQLKELIGEAQLLAVVKANAYGHGAIMVARTALASGATWLGVARVDEGIQLRNAGITSPILVLGHTPYWEADSIVEHRLTPTVTTKRLALALAVTSATRGVVTPVHMKVDTGLTRYGLLPEEIIPFACALQSLPSLRLESLYTHFATSDEADKSFLQQQFQVYQETLRQLAEAGISLGLRHAANSGATLDAPETRLDMVRCGISIYGLYPSATVSRQVQLRPAMSIKALIGRVRVVPAGTSVSYGRTYIAKSNVRVALIPAGYADGLTRALSNKGHVLIQGRRAQIVGRVCMDNCVVDVSHIPEVRQGEEAVIIGRQGMEEITADELAQQIGTINYEVTTSIGARVPRVFLRQGQPVATDMLTESRYLL